MEYSNSTANTNKIRMHKERSRLHYHYHQFGFSFFEIQSNDWKEARKTNKINFKYYLLGDK